MKRWMKWVVLVLALGVALFVPEIVQAQGGVCGNVANNPCWTPDLSDPGTEAMIAFWLAWLSIMAAIWFG